MSIKENLRRLFLRTPKPEQFGSTETHRGISVQFYDLRETKAAKERGVEPGYYLTVYPILPPDLEDSMLLHKLSHFLLEKLKDEGLLESSDTRIPIDNKNKMFVDPAQSWFFSPAGYIDTMQLLVVRADHAGRDDAQRIIVAALR